MGKIKGGLLSDLTWGVTHFKGFFAEDKHGKVGDMMKILALFLRMVD
jgi:hypothetical protein